MDFSTALAQTQAVRDTRCIIGKLLADRPDRDEIDAALASDLTHAHLSRALTLVLGVKIDQNAVGRHRRTGGCCGS